MPERTIFWSVSDNAGLLLRSRDTGSSSRAGGRRRCEGPLSRQYSSGVGADPGAARGPCRAAATDPLSPVRQSAAHRRRRQARHHRARPRATSGAPRHDRGRGAASAASRAAAPRVPTASQRCARSGQAPVKTGNPEPKRTATGMPPASVQASPGRRIARCSATQSDPGSSAAAARRTRRAVPSR